MPKTLLANYQDIRSSLLSGDLVFFDGDDGLFSWVIRKFTGRPTHVAILLRTEDERWVLMESTTLNEGKRGVQRSYLSERIQAYRGRVWIGMLSPEARKQIEVSVLQAWLEKQEGKRYDMAGAIYSGLDQLVRFLPDSKYSRAFFCSRLAMAALRIAGLQIVEEYSPTPHQLCRMPLFSVFRQVKGELTEL